MGAKEGEGRTGAWERWEKVSRELDMDKQTTVLYTIARSDEKEPTRLDHGKRGGEG